MVRVNRWLVPVACALAQTVTVTPGSVPDPRPGPGTVAGLVAGLAAGLVLRWRHAAPLGVLAASVTAYAAQVLLSVAAVPVAPSVGAFGAGRRGGPVRGPLAAVGASALTAGALAVAGAGDLTPFAVAAILAAALAGVAVALSAARTAAVRREAALEERVRLARDLHDVVGHGMSGITVQAGAARTALAAGSTAEAGAALARIEAAGRTVLRDVRWLVGLLRAEEDAPALHRLPALVDAARRAGLDVDLRVDGDLDRVDAAAGEAAYRIAQESLTNVLRHSGAHAVTVHADARDGVRLTVTDDGTGTGDGDPAPGGGIRGMYERAEAAGGRLEAGPRPGGGWSTVLTVPRGRR
jgi:signal transduction histidine kinase